MILLHLPGHTGQENESMDRIRIMKTLFLLDKQIDQRLSNFYQFTPYLYGPFSLEVYTDLDELRQEGHIQLELTLPLNWSRYRLTEKGISAVDKIYKEIPAPLKTKMREVKNLVTGLSFVELLRYVYKEYPEYAYSSVIKVL